MGVLNMFDYQLLVIGAGSGGVRAARLAAQQGLRVAVVEQARLGGTCVNLGCVPKKLYTYAAAFGEDNQLARAYGWEVDANLAFDWQRLQRNVQAELRRLNSIYGQVLASSGASVHFGAAEFVDEHTVSVDGKSLRAEKILLACGSTPVKPSIPGADLFAVSDDFFAWDSAPQSLLVYGGGYIGLEIAAICARLGVDTHLVVRKDLPLSGFDDEVRARVAEELPKCGVRTHFGNSIAELEPIAGGVRARLSDGASIDCERALAATGRKPLTAPLQLARAGVNVDAKGAVIVDAHYQTNIDHIYAIGDVISRVSLTPVAIREAVYFHQRHILQSEPKPIDYQMIATAVFTQPNIGTVGMTEQDARAAGYKVKFLSKSFHPMRSKLGGSDAQSFYKLVVDESSDKVLGVHITGDNAGEIIQGFAVALLQGITKQQLDECVAIHPTSAEELVTM